MKTLNIFNETEKDVKEYEIVLNEIFKQVNEQDSFSVIFVSNEKIKDLNNTYRKINEVTDVLSFLSDEEGYLGDVFIALEKAEAQALEFEHTIKREISFLVVHGYLHLKGYTHDTLEDEKIMNNLTKAILKKDNKKD